MGASVVGPDVRARGTLLWATVALDTARDITAGHLDDPLRHVAQRALEVGDADRVTVVSAGANDDTVVATTAVGLDAGAWDGCILDARTSRAAQVLRTAEPARFDTAGPSRGTGVASVEHLLIVPLCDSLGARAALSLGRVHGRAPFTDDDLVLATLFAGQVAFALELAEGPARRDRSARIDERDRIARELTRHVIGRLFSLGLALQGAASDAAPASARQFESAADEIDETVKQIRATIYRLAATPPVPPR